MQPLPKSITSALREAYPRLTDAHLDRLQSLLADRVALDAEEAPELAAALDQQLEQLIAEHMPRFREIVMGTHRRLEG